MFAEYGRNQRENIYQKVKKMLRYKNTLNRDVNKDCISKVCNCNKMLPFILSRVSVTNNAGYELEERIYLLLIYATSNYT
jgi:hypothetical protein